MLAAVLEYNRRGALIGMTFHAADGAALPVAYAEVYCDEKGLAVRALPEPDRQEVADALNPPVADPRKVPGAASVGELKRLADD